MSSQPYPAVGEFCSPPLGGGCLCCQCHEFQFFLAAFQVDGLVLVKLAIQGLDCQGILKFALDGLFERSGPVIRMITNFDWLGARYLMRLGCVCNWTATRLMFSN